MSKEIEYGEVPSVEIVVHEPPPAGRRWNATELTLEPSVSLALALSVIVWRRFAPGSVRVEVGAAVSDFVSLDEVATATLPKLSETLYRYLAHLPEARVSGLEAAVQLPYDEQALLARSPVCRSSDPVEAFTSGSEPSSVVIA